MAKTLPATSTDPYYEFDVVVEKVIGTVGVSDDPTAEKPHVVAFKLIAEHDSEGVYTFPMPDGSTTRVTVEWVNNSRSK